MVNPRDFFAPLVIMLPTLAMAGESGCLLFGVVLPADLRTMILEKETELAKINKELKDLEHYKVYRLAEHPLPYMVYQYMDFQ